MTQRQLHPDSRWLLALLAALVALGPLSVDVYLPAMPRMMAALDTDIRITKYHDILSIIKAHPELTRILLPGYSAAHSTTRSFLNYIKKNGIRSSEIPPIKAEAGFKIYVDDREIECVILNSTSTAAKIRYEVLLEQFKRNLK